MKCAFLFASLATVLILFSSSSRALSRGPYLPQTSDLLTTGLVVAREGLNERCESPFATSCEPYVEFTLSQTATGFDFGKIIYDCKEIDDGPYGALQCEQTGFKTLSSFSTCTSGGVRLSPSDLDFYGWLCR